MFKRKVLLFLSCISFLFLIIFLPPFVFSTLQQSPFCSKAAYAQDNPCLAQDATISALQLELINSNNAVQTVVAIQDSYYMSTITYLESLTKNSVDTAATLPSSTSFTETFDDNSRGWSITADENHAVHLSQGKLLITSDNDGHYYYVPIPDMNATSYAVEVYVTIDVNVYLDGYVGFALGDFNAGTYYYLLYGHCALCDPEFKVSVVEYGDLDTLYDTAAPALKDTILMREKPVKLNLIVENGMATLYVNDVQGESISLPYGTQVGLAYFALSSHSAAIFDNLSVRY